MGRAEEQQAPVGMAGSHLNVPLTIAMERLGIRSQMRNSSTFQFENANSGGGGSVGGSSSSGRKGKVATEKSAVDRAVLEMIASGDWEGLKPNSNKSVAVGNHHICVNFSEEMEVGYRAWEWHGHMLVYDAEEGMYRPEYIYGNYFEPLDAVRKFAANEARMIAMLTMQQQQQRHRFF